MFEKGAKFSSMTLVLFAFLVASICSAAHFDHHQVLPLLAGQAVSSVEHSIDPTGSPSTLPTHQSILEESCCVLIAAVDAVPFQWLFALLSGLVPSLLLLWIIPAWSFSPLPRSQKRQFRLMPTSLVEQKVCLTC